MKIQAIGQKENETTRFLRLVIMLSGHLTWLFQIKKKILGIVAIGICRCKYSGDSEEAET